MSAEGLSVKKPLKFIYSFVFLSLAFSCLPPQPLTLFYINKLCKPKEKVKYKCFFLLLLDNSLLLISLSV